MSSKVIIADDHQLFIDGLKLILNELPGAEFVAQAGNGKELMRLLKSYKADMVLLDLNMPVMNGFEALKNIKKHYPQVKVIVLSMHYEKYMVSQVIHDQADGYLVKNSDKTEFQNAITSVAAGGKYFSGELMTKILHETEPNAGNATAQLSMREVEIIRLLAEGLSSMEIGERISLSPRTIDTHRTNILQKLELKNTAGLISFAFKNKLIT